MAYTALSTVNTNDDWSAADHNKLRDNFIASVPDIFTTKGQIAIATGLTTLSAVSGSDGQALTADSGEPSGVKWASINKIPVGGIIMWSGSLGSLPSWWQICDGTNGTPDLRDQFVVGAGDQVAVDETGGATTGDWSHTHSGTTGSDGAHTHTLTVSNENTHKHLDYTSGYSLASLDVGDSGSLARSTSHTHKIDLLGVNHTHTNRDGATSDPGTHTHTIGPSSSTGSATENILPPYYALAYIQRLS